MASDRSELRESDLSLNQFPQRKFPMAAGILFGLGLGGFLDGIVLHQLLQWHHMLSSWYPTNTIENLELNIRWDGIFHSITYAFLVVGLFVLWQSAHRHHLFWSNKLFTGTLLVGWGVFNFVEGIIDHQVLGVHHVNELVAQSHQIYWDVGFLAWGLAMIAGGWAIVRTGKLNGLCRAQHSSYLGVYHHRWSILISRSCLCSRRCRLGAFSCSNSR